MLTIGTIYRNARPYNNTDEYVDGLPNYDYQTYIPHLNKGFQFQRGIHTVAKVVDPDGNERCPLIIISSSPFKAGSKDTPWRDTYAPDHGYVKYYGDNKTVGEDPNSKQNKVLIDLLPIYNSTSVEERLLKAVPVVFFERVTVNGRLKGNLKFQGYGILESAQLVTQFDEKKNQHFSNYMFNFCIFTLKNDSEEFDWDWIAKRCDPAVTAKECLQAAPSAWKEWVRNGSDKLHLYRRNVAINGVVNEVAQKPSPNDQRYRLLSQIYKYYDNNKHSFEYLAMEVTKKVIEENGATCTPGWITKKSSDGGVDYISRIDIGNDSLSGIRIIVLGQAKCTSPASATNGRDIARVVARLKRGWVGAFVTTSYYTKNVQIEVNEDQYPIMLINGLKVAEIVEKELFDNKLSLNAYLDDLESKYEINYCPPEEIMLY